MCNHPADKMEIKATARVENGGYCETCSYAYAVAKVQLRCECGFETEYEVNDDYGPHSEWHAIVVGNSVEA